MPLLYVSLACVLLVVGTTVLHYEVLRLLNFALPSLRIPHRAKLIVVILAAFLAHSAEIALYGFAFYGLIGWLEAGSLVGTSSFSLGHCLYFSAESYTSLGLGDFTPVGPVRLLAGVEALNGLLLIGWSVSFTYLAMERFWKVPAEEAADDDPS